MKILHNVRKFYGTDLYEVEDVISYSKGSSHYGTPVYIAGLSDYCMFYSKSLSAFVLEQYSPTNNVWEQVTTIPVETVPTSVRFTFDQNGHIAIVWESGEYIYRYWYDTAIGEAVTTLVGKGRSPHILMETYNEVLQPVRQIVMVYVTEDNRLVYLLQDDRYTIEYLIEENVEAVVMLGHTVRNSMKLVYLAQEGVYNYRYKSIGSDRLGEWFGDNAAGEDIQFIIDDLSLQSVIHTLPFTENPVQVDRDLLSFNIGTVPSLVDKFANTENPVNISRSLESFSIIKRATIFEEEFEEPVPLPISSYLEPNSLSGSIRDVRIDIEQEELIIPEPLEHTIGDLRLEIFIEMSHLANYYNQLIGQTLDEELYTEESWADYQNALDAAELVVGDPTASRQLVTDTFYNLKDARGNLKYKDHGEGDPHWGNVVALLHFDGDTVNQVTQNNETVKGILTFQQHDPLFGMSVEIDASKDMGILLSDGLDTSGDFTIELLSKKINGTKYFIIDNRIPESPGTFYVVVENGKLAWRIFGLHASKQFTVNFPEGFNHVTLVKESNRYSLYLNGVGVDSVIGNVPTVNNIVAVGFSEKTKSDTNGVHLLDELRITKGVARYTEDFIPPTEPFPNFKSETFNPPAGRLVSLYSCNITDRASHDPDAVSEPTYEERFGLISHYYLTHKNITLPHLYMKTNTDNSETSITNEVIPLPKLMGRYLHIAARNGTWSPDIASGYFEFLDKDNNVVLILQAYKQVTFGTNLRYGTNPNNLTDATYAVRGNVRGNLLFTESSVQYISDPVESSGSYIHDFEVFCNVPAIVAVRVTANTKSTYTGGDGGAAYVYLTLRDHDYEPD